MKLWTLIEREIVGFSRKVWVVGSKNLSVWEQMNHEFPPKSVDRTDYEPGIFEFDSLGVGGLRYSPETADCHSLSSVGKCLYW